MPRKKKSQTTLVDEPDGSRSDISRHDLQTLTEKIESLTLNSQEQFQQMLQKQFQLMEQVLNVVKPKQPLNKVLMPSGGDATMVLSDASSGSQHQQGDENEDIHQADESNAAQPTDLTSPASEKTLIYKVFRSVTIQNFYGEPDKARTWLRAYEKASTANGWDDDLRLSHVGYYLKKEAEDWYYSRIDDSVRTWTQFVNQFERRYLRKSQRLQLKQQLEHIRQEPEENTLRFMDRVLKICAEYDPAMEEREKLRFVIKGINDSIRMMWVSLDDDKRTLEKLGKMVIDSADYEERLQKFERRVRYSNIPENRRTSQSRTFNNRSRDWSRNQPETGSNDAPCAPAPRPNNTLRREVLQFASTVEGKGIIYVTADFQETKKGSSPREKSIRMLDALINILSLRLTK